MRTFSKDPDEQAKRIESKQNLLAYLRSGPKHLTIETYLCLARILHAAGWHFDEGLWTKNEDRQPTLMAAIIETERQIASERDRLLRQTVASYGSEHSLSEVAAEKTTGQN